MTANVPAHRSRLIPGLDLELDDVIDAPATVRDIATDTLDPEVAVAIHCTEGLITYVEELHGRRLDEFLSGDERARVAQFIDSLGNNPARADEYYVSSSLLGYPRRDPGDGWNLEDTREANRLASRHQNDPTLPDYARESLLLLTALVDYLDALHGSTGFREILTPAERDRVAEIVSAILDGPTHVR
ncbi:hypothetical protein [Kribbella sp. NPDC049584]|uniref:hypothetical protein n=1 Tax=Kribbella sp. NPDC049584 TaxID=3154833 RepID=UPI0034275C67